jgi:hypothetical protein
VERLAKIAGNTQGKFVVCAYGEGIKKVRHVTNDARAVAGIIAAISDLRAIPGANVYILPGLVHLHVREGSRGGVKDMVARFALVADFDRHEGATIDWVAKMPADAHFVCETSPGNFQCWLFFDKPYEPAEVAPIGKALVPMLDDHDGVIGDMARVVRVPNTFNHPNKKKLAEGRSPTPFVARIERDVEEWSQGYSLEELRAKILCRDPEAFERLNKRASDERKSSHRKPNAKQTRNEIDFDWDTRKNPSETAKPMADTSVVRALSGEGDRSAAAFKLIRRFQRANYSADEVVAALLRYANLPVMAHYGKPVNEKRIRDDVRRAFGKPDLRERRSESAFRDTAAGLAVPLREIRVQGGALVENVDDAEAALIAQGIAIYQRGSFLVRRGQVIIERRNQKTTTDELIVTVTEPALKEMMTDAAKFLRYDARMDDWKEINCPKEIADAYLARTGVWKLHPLMGVINAPTLRTDGSLLDTPGYDDATGLIYDPRGASFPAIPDEPSKDDARAALALFNELICKFPFASEEARSVALAAILTSCVRRTLPKAPMFGVDGTGQGSGKGLLVDTTSIIGSGSPAASITAGTDEAELEKRIGSLLLSGAAAISIDNLTRPLESDFLAMIITQPAPKMRILGRSQTVTVPTNALLFATGNGLTCGSDMWRRVPICLIDPAVERPSERRFDFNPAERALRNRGRYVAAALTVLRAYQVAGSPAQDGKAMGSFEEWCLLVRDALLWLGEADPVATCVPPCDDPDRERFVALILAWQAIIGEKRGVTLKEAIRIATDGATTSSTRSELFDAFHAVAAPMVRGSDSKIDVRRLGIWLRSKKRLVIGGLRLMPEGESQAGMRWRLERASGRAP